MKKAENSSKGVPGPVITKPFTEAFRLVLLKIEMAVWRFGPRKSL